jgi:hypothetical protein
MTLGAFSSGTAVTRWGRPAATWVVVAALGACATPPASYDYTAFRQNRPVSMLVLPPVNETPEVSATYGVLSQVTLPLAEAGYYVVPVSLMDETFRQNGLNSPVEIHDVSPRKLREIFGADAAVYIKVTRYGTSYAVIASETRVTAQARIVDLRTGELLWQGSATASSSEGRSSSQGGLAGLLVSAVITQIVETASDTGFKYASIVSQWLFSPRKNGVLYGPRSPNYQTD